MNELERIREEKMKKLTERVKDDKMEMEVNDNDFEEKVISKSKEVAIVVDFWAEWCMPCLMLSPVLEKLAKEYNGKFVLAKFNIAANQQIAQKYGVMSIPNVKMFKDGKVLSEFVGALPESSVRSWLDKNL